jgi:hypothetical protein
VQDYYELEMNIEKFTKMMNKLNIARHKRTLDLQECRQIVDNFTREFGLLDSREFKVTAPELAA